MRGIDFVAGVATGLLLDTLTSLLPQPARIVMVGLFAAALLVYCAIGIWKSHNHRKHAAHFTRTLIEEIERQQHNRR